MMYWRDDYENKVSTPKKALAFVKPGDAIFISGGCSFPKYITENLLKKDAYRDNKILTPFTFMPSPYSDPELQKRFRVNSFYMDSEVERGVQNGRVDYTPIHTSELPHMFETGRIHLDVAIIQVSPPDMHGFCSLGTSVDISKAAAVAADVVIAEVNRQMPRTLGDCFIHVSQIDHLIEVDYPVEREMDPEGIEPAVIEAVAKNAATLISDGATLQIGIGQIPNAVLGQLKDRKHLGIHTEMFSDGVVDLVEAGVITGERKTIHKKKIITSFVIGSYKLIDFVNNNPMVEFHPSNYTNDPLLIARNYNMIAINTASSVDLTGQVITDFTGMDYVANPGGQEDFIRGAIYGKGRSIIALPSSSNDGETSRIVPHVPHGAGVSSSREDVHYIVTEYGIAHLRGKTIANRALELINIAHPAHRTKLIDLAVAMGYLPQEQSKRPYLGKPYPKEFESKETFDGTKVLVRPVKPTDEDMMKDLFYSFSPQTLRQRFFSERMIQPRIERMSQVNIDYDLSMTFGIFTGETNLQRMIAVCGYEREPRANSAEVFFAVRDKWQGKGLGTFMLNKLIEVGKSRNVKTFTAEVLSSNVSMLNIFYRTGLNVSAKLEDDVYIVSFDLVKQSK